uniref:Uncharacterized protein n=1 Tax=Euplotes harpa TaxID=151035 RepID=A0A7S3J5I8_9SPIT|mmetsp:Transcript_18579/g.21347  ORF Transcript_18579/g.21347 Transcript_18579/m.21347 type:complete len:106 (+) Transcript_18579:1949-2266(+)
MASVSSPTAVWLIFNQLRSLALLILTGSYIPYNLRNYLLGFKLFQLNLSFLQVQSVPFVKDALGGILSAQPDTDLEDVGLEYESALMNDLGILFTVLAFAGVHLA